MTAQVCLLALLSARERHGLSIGSRCLISCLEGAMKFSRRLLSTSVEPKIGLVQSKALRRLDVSSGFPIICDPLVKGSCTHPPIAFCIFFDPKRVGTCSRDGF